MKLLLIRHAAAVPRGTPGVPDDERPLTPDGKAKFRVAARGLARVTRRPDLLLTSPLLRARATAEIALGAALLGIGFIPSGLAGLALGVFGGSLTRLYLRAPGTRREGTIAPSQQGIVLAKDSWMLAIGTALVLDALFGSGRKRKKSS